ncbi:MAG TPA: TRAM domain-containing protein [Micromonosporaceae bacterium]|nr:TRAM domain-containing protein [Micromonosporaceae bacterium]
MTCDEGARLELVAGAVAHGGHCVARHDGMVVFVRHALPGERVVAEVTEARRGYLRADAVEVVEASPDRVPAPCPYARPGACGGCDLQHASEEAQRRWKAAVVSEQLARLAGLTPTEIQNLGVRVAALPGGLLGWRSRVRYTVSAEGRAGLLKHRSHEVVPIDRCRIAHPALQRLDVTATRWPEAETVEVVASSAGDVSVLATYPDRVHLVSGPEQVREDAAGRRWRLDASGFWQGHRAAPDTFAGAVLELLEPRPGESAWDLYGGAGLFAAALAGRLGPTGTVTLVEADRRGAAAARANLSGLAGVRVVRARVQAVLRRGLPRPDVVVLDPPRSGAGAEVVRGIIAAAPRAVAYVACDPAAFARDVRTFREAGWELAALRGYDAFPMTHHVELVGLLIRPAA